jgi:hypothetical protein
MMRLQGWQKKVRGPQRGPLSQSVCVLAAATAAPVAAAAAAEVVAATAAAQDEDDNNDPPAATIAAKTISEHIMYSIPPLRLGLVLFL